MTLRRAPGVSIIIPTCNRAGLLKEALESALAQDYPAVEVVVVDDGSTDETPALLDAYQGRVRCLRQPSGGVAAARNAGLRASKGDLVTFLDDDDRFYPKKVAHEAQLLLHKPAAGFVHCRHDYLDAGGHLLARGGPLPEGDVLVELLGGNFIWSGGPLLRRELVERAGGFDERLSSAADYDLWLRICAAGVPLACAQTRLGAYRLQPGSMVTGVQQTEAEVNSILERIFKCPDLPRLARDERRSAENHWRLWFCRRYYAIGAVETGRERLRQLVEHDPDQAGGEQLEQSFVDEANDWRVADGAAYLGAVFDHLPAEAGFLAQRRAALTARVRLADSLKACARGEDDQAAQALGQSFGLDPSLPGQTDRLAREVAHYAVLLPVEPLAFTGRFLALLHTAVPGWRGDRAVNAAVRSALGFAAFAAGRRRAPALHFLRAALLSPAILRNRGLLVAWLKSLPGLVMPDAEAGGDEG